VDDKSNEITAIPDLLDLLTLNGAIVTIDAMGCQKNIAARIINRNADYILALKGNQGTLRDDVELFFTEQEARDFADTRVFRHTTTGKIMVAWRSGSMPSAQISNGCETATRGPD
jgi:predicted transposase YbfD/YdcC